MKAFGEVVTVCGVAPEELTLWIQRGWILPLAADGDYLFNEADLARAHMILEFKRDLAIDEEAMPLVLDLVDRLYALRRHLRELLKAIRDLPEDQREAILRRLAPDESAF